MLLVGCGMMGARHVRGIAELEAAAPGSIRLAAVCDLNEEAAEKVAAEAEQLLGTRPLVYTDLNRALQGNPDLDVADLVTDPRSHDEIAVQLLEAGLHVICEKPLALTVRRGQRMVEAARRCKRVLAVAENNRRDPMNRLARACIEAGLIGAPNFLLQISIGSASGIIATAWRHQLRMGGVMLDVAIHNGYIIEYLLGPIDKVCARAQIAQRLRRGRQFDGSEVEVEVDAEDVLTAALTFERGALGQWTTHFASPGHTMTRRLIIGTEGTIDCPPDRSGRPVVVQRSGETLSGGSLLSYLPDYRLNEIESKLFGERPAEYKLDGPVTDRKLIAAEMYDFVDAVRAGRRPEADGEIGLRSVAIIYALLESAMAGEIVEVQDVLSGAVHAYQDRVEACV